VQQTRGGGGDGGSRPPRAGGGGGGGDGSGGGGSGGGFWAAYMAVLDRCVMSRVDAALGASSLAASSVQLFSDSARALLATRLRSSPSPLAASTCWVTSSARRVRCSHVCYAGCLPRAGCRRCSSCLKPACAPRQLFFEDGPFNVRRAAIFTALGGVLIGPVLHYWCAKAPLYNAFASTDGKNLCGTLDVAGTLRWVASSQAQVPWLRYAPSLS
jgi:hypothetical protein